MKIELENRTQTDATLVRHLRTLTGSRNVDIDLCRLPDGREIVTEWAGDARHLPCEIPGETADQYQGATRSQRPH